LKEKALYCAGAGTLVNSLTVPCIRFCLPSTFYCMNIRPYFSWLYRYVILVWRQFWWRESSSGRSRRFYEWHVISFKTAWTSRVLFAHQWLVDSRR